MKMPKRNKLNIVSFLQRSINWIICKRYPFLKIDTPVYPWIKGYTSIWIDEMEPGWRTAFGWKLCEELRAYLKKNNITNYHVTQVKEKYGTLCWYDNWFEIQGNYKLHEDVLRKYITLSSNTCVICGKPATHKSVGYILPYCSECHKEGDVCHYDVRYKKKK